MKYSELHRIIIKSGWHYLYARGSHYYYEKNGIISTPVPHHGSKEIGEGLRRKIFKEMQLTTN